MYFPREDSRRHSCDQPLERGTNNDSDDRRPHCGRKPCGASVDRSQQCTYEQSQHYLVHASSSVCERAKRLFSYATVLYNAWKKSFELSAMAIEDKQRA